MASSDRKGGGLSLRTLAIASLASATAATVVSRVFPPGTVYASALTPVIVAAVSELLNRPVDRVTSLREQRRAMIRERRESEVSRVLGEEPNPLRGAPAFAQGAEGFDDEAMATSGNGHRTGADPLEGLRIHGRRRRRMLHPKVWIATGIIAFAIAVAVLTLPELIFGGAIATNHRTTIFGGSTGRATHTTTTSTSTGTTPTATVTVPAQTPTGTDTTTSTTTGTGTGTSTTTTNGGTTAPAPTPTSTGGTPAQP